MRRATYRMNGEELVAAADPLAAYPDTDMALEQLGWAQHRTFVGEGAVFTLELFEPPDDVLQPYPQPYSSELDYDSLLILSTHGRQYYIWSMNLLDTLRALQMLGGLVEEPEDDAAECGGPRWVDEGERMPLGFQPRRWEAGGESEQVDGEGDEIIRWEADPGDNQPKIQASKFSGDTRGRYRPLSHSKRVGVRTSARSAVSVRTKRAALPAFG